MGGAYTVRSIVVGGDGDGDGDGAHSHGFFSPKSSPRDCWLVICSVCRPWRHRSSPHRGITCIPILIITDINTRNTAITDLLLSYFKSFGRSEIQPYEFLCILAGLQVSA